MYIDPLNGEGLFPIDEAGEKSERDLPFEYQPGVDYFAKFDSILPKWTLFPFDQVTGSEGAFSDSTGPAEVRVAPRTNRVVSYRKYVRAIDPAGNLCQLIVSTVRPSPYYKDGNDKCGTLNRVVATKNQAGWIIVENNQMFWNPYSGKAGQQYAAWAWAVMEYRQKRHAAHEKAEALAFMSKAEKAAREQREGMKEMGMEIGRALREEAQQAAQASKPGRRQAAE